MSAADTLDALPWIVAQLRRQVMPDQPPDVCDIRITRDLSHIVRCTCGAWMWDTRACRTCTEMYREGVA